MSVEYPWQSIRICTRNRSNKEIIIRILPYPWELRISEKISIREHISAYLWRYRNISAFTCTPNV